MREDIFGDLNDWGIVLDRIEALRKSSSLDQHQRGLMRILRYRQNWKLSETVLGCIKDLKQPDADLVEAVRAIVMNDEVYYEQRILAADCLGYLCRQLPDARDKALSGMRRLLDSPQPPFFHRTLRTAVQQLEDPEAAGARARREDKS